MVLNTITSVILFFWGFFAMTSPMLFNSKGTMNNITAYKTVLGIFYLPCYLFTAYWFFGWTYFDYSPERCLLVSLIVVTIFAWVYIANFFKLLRGILPEGYSTTTEKVYFDGKAIHADVASFHILDTQYAGYSAHSHYAADKRAVYIDGRVLRDADPSSFKLVYEKLGLWADKNSVYCFGSKVPDAKPEDIAIVSGNTQYWHDKHRLYYRDTLIETSETPLAPYFVGSYLIGNMQAYYQGKPLLKARPKALNIVDNIENYAADDTYAYYEAELIAADVASFQVLSPPYSKDANQLFYESTALSVPENIELASFSFLNNNPQHNIAFDNNNIYFIHQSTLKVIAKNQHQQIKILGKGYLTFNNLIYYITASGPPYVAEVEGTNFDTFRVLSGEDQNNHHRHYDARDNLYVYKAGKRLEQH